MKTKVSKDYKLITAIQVLGLLAIYILEKMTFGRGGLVHHLLFRKRQFLKLLPLPYLRGIGIVLIVLAVFIASRLGGQADRKYIRIESVIVFSSIGIGLALNLQVPLRSYAYLTVTLLVIALVQGIKYYSEYKKYNKERKSTKL